MFKKEIFMENLKEYRRKMHLTQTELAEKLFISEQSVSKWEKGKSLPDVVKLCEIADILNVSLEELLLKQNSDTNVYLAVDGGGTKTEFVLFYETGEIINHVVLEGCNPNVRGIENTCDVLKRGINLVCPSKMHISGMHLGIAGCGLNENSVRVRRFLSGLYPKCRITCSSDIFNVVHSVDGCQRAIAVICGTGSSVFAFDGKDIHRFGGWGYLLGDVCSGYEIGRKALRAVLAQEEGLGGETLLTDAVHKKLCGGVFHKIGEIYAKERSFIASFAPLVFETAEKGDKAALEIIQNESRELAHIINAAAGKYDCDNKVILSGGIFKNTELMEEAVRDKLDAGLEIILPRMPQIYGAAVLCMKNNEVLNDLFKKLFIESYNNL